MVRVHFIMEKEVVIKEIFSMIKEMELENTFFLMAMNIKVFILNINKNNF